MPQTNHRTRVFQLTSLVLLIVSVLMSFVHLFHIELRSHAEEAIAIEAQMALPVIRHEIRANYHPEQQSSNIGKYVRAAIQPVYHLQQQKESMENLQHNASLRQYRERVGKGSESSSEAGVLYGKYMDLMYGLSSSSIPRVGNPFEEVSFTCGKVYCGNLGEEGLSNSLISFLGLLTHAYNDGACVCDPYVMVEHPRYTNNTREDRRRLTDFLNITKDPDHWRSMSMPPIVYEYHTKWFQKPALFGRTNKIMTLLGSALKLGVVLPKHPVLSNYFKVIFCHPSDSIQRIINKYPDHFTAVHARVEHDFRTYKNGSEWARTGKNVTDILNILNWGLQMHLGQDLDAEAFQNIVIAASIDNVLGKSLSSPSDERDLEGEEILTDLRQNETFWGASVQLSEKPGHLSYFEKSLIDMLVCQRATYFVGHFWSTFTKTISFFRHDKSTTFHYGSGELVPIDRAKILDVLIS